MNEKYPNTIYMIDIPYVSNGLRRTYMKHLEVFKMELNEDETKYSSRSKFTYTNKNGFKEVQSKYRYMQTRYLNIHDDIVKSAGGGELYFSDFDKAFASKLILIQDMKRKFEKEINEITERMNKNCPDVDDLLSEYKLKLPECFI